MAMYYVNDNPQTSGEHEVHESDCAWLKFVKSKTFLGFHEHCSAALQSAKSFYVNVDGCAFCCSSCHKK